MSQTDSPRQNKLLDYFDRLAAVSNVVADRCTDRENLPPKRAGVESSGRPQNPLVPPPHGSGQGPSWWPHNVAALNGLGHRPDTSAGDPFVIGDLSNSSAKVTAALALILLLVLVIVLAKDHYAPVAATRTEPPQAAIVAAGTQIEMASEASNPPMTESSAILTLPTVQESEPEDNALTLFEDKVSPKEAAAIEIKPAQTQDAEPADTPETVTVKGILYSRDNPSAIIGDRVVHVGDAVLDAIVVGITRDRVIFEKTGQRWDRRVLDAVATP